MAPASAPMVTRCPKCGTAFRITSAQLQSAKGAVRCGSCLHIFKAQDHLVDVATKTKSQNPVASKPAADNRSDREAKPNPNPAAPKATPGAAPKPAASTNAVGEPGKSANPVKATSAPKTQSKPATPAQQTSLAFNKPLLEDDDMLISDDMDDPKTKSETNYEFDSFLDIDVKPSTSSSLFDRPFSTTEKDDEDEAQVDESWAEMLIDEEEQKPVSPRAQKSFEEELEAFAQPQAQASVESTPATAPPTGKPGLVFSLIGEKEEEVSSAKNQADADDEKPDSSLFDTPTDEPKRQVKTEPKIRAYDSSRSNLLMNIIPAPVEFTAKRMRSWQHKLWPLLSLLALIMLVVQIGWFKFDYLSRIEPYRNIYRHLCPMLGCQLPALIDTSRIKAYNLVVRSHPDQANALLVDAIILNTAPFDQPFPDLVLAFSDINDKPLAARRFTPKEYLGGELAGRELMPKNQPIQLSLDLVDPGPDAVNYHVYIP